MAGLYRIDNTAMVIKMTSVIGHLLFFGGALKKECFWSGIISEFHTVPTRAVGVVSYARMDPP